MDPVHRLEADVEIENHNDPMEEEIALGEINPGEGLEDLDYDTFAADLPLV